MDDSPALVPLVLTAHIHLITAIEGNSRCEIDVMGDEHRVARLELDDESLMARALEIVRQYPRYRSLELDDDVRALGREE